MQELIKGLRGELINCGCHGYSGSECFCDCIWPEHVASKAADLIESQAAEIANLQSLWTIAHAERSEAMNELAKTRSICDQMGDALEEAMYSNSTQRSIDKSVAANKAWRAMK